MKIKLVKPRIDGLERFVEKTACEHTRLLYIWNLIKQKEQD